MHSAPLQNPLLSAVAMVFRVKAKNSYELFSVDFSEELSDQIFKIYPSTFCKCTFICTSTVGVRVLLRGAGFSLLFKRPISLLVLPNRAPHVLHIITSITSFFFRGKFNTKSWEEVYTASSPFSPRIPIWNTNLKLSLPYTTEVICLRDLLPHHHTLVTGR